MGLRKMLPDPIETTAWSAFSSISGVITPLLAGVIAALIGWFGNYHIQHRMYRRLRRVEDLKDKLYGLLGIVSKYRIAGGATEQERRGLEAELVAAQHVLMSEFVSLPRMNKKFRHQRSRLANIQLDLLDTATGGEFHAADWKADPQRVRKMARIVTRLVNILT